MRDHSIQFRRDFELFEYNKFQKLQVIRTLLFFCENKSFTLFSA